MKNLLSDEAIPTLKASLKKQNIPFMPVNGVTTFRNSSFRFGNIVGVNLNVTVGSDYDNSVGIIGYLSGCNFPDTAEMYGYCIKNNQYHMIRCVVGPNEEIHFVGGGTNYASQRKPSNGIRSLLLSLTKGGAYGY